MAWKKKTRFPRRPSRKRAKYDIQTLSLCSQQYGLTFGPDGSGGHDGTCTQPVAFAFPIAHGGTQFTAANTPQGAPGLASESARGVAVKGIQFDFSGWGTAYSSTFTEDVGIVIGHYFAIVRAEFDTMGYQLGGQVVPEWPRIPNIIASDYYAGGALGTLQQPVFQREEDIFFRGFEEFPSRNNFQCPSLVQSEACESLAPPPIMVVPDLASTAGQVFTRALNLRHVKLRTGRFLKPNQALFWVDNFICSIANTNFVVNTGFNQTIYGTIATRVAR